VRNIIRAGIAVALLSFLAFSGPLAAGPLEDAAAAYCRGDYALAMRRWRPLADQSNSLAQFRIMYANGRAVPLDDSVAVSWYRKAADQGYAIGQYNVGVTRTSEKRASGQRLNLDPEFEALGLVKCGKTPSCRTGSQN
jgi:TPR repeat protein